MKYKNKKRFKGVPIGYPENWKYTGRWSEKKVAPRRWRFSFKATKRRKANTYGSFGKGTKGIWKINAIQYITKTNKGEYQTHMVGTKKAIKFKVVKPKYYKKYNKRW